MQQAPMHQAQDRAAVPPQTDRGHPRAEWIDIARGVGVILVVYGHILGGLVRAGMFPDTAPARWMDYTLYTFHMPLFFFLAGLNVPHSLRRGRAGFLRTKAWTIAYPYVLWSLVQGAVIMTFAHDTNIPIHASDLAAIWYRPVAQFWFLYALMICHLAAALLPGRVALALAAAVAFVVFNLLPRDPGLSYVLHDLAFYVAGILGARAVAGWRPAGGRGWALLAALSAAFAAAVAVGGRLGAMDSAGLTALPACVLGIAATVVASKLVEGPRCRWLALAGAMSMTIYILHLLAGSGTRLVMLKLHVPVLPWLYLAVGTLAGVLLPMAIHAVLRRLDLLAPLGLAPPSRRAADRAGPVGTVAAPGPGRS